jgi:hypothetical protein
MTLRGNVRELGVARIVAKRARSAVSIRAIAGLD